MLAMFFNPTFQKNVVQHFSLQNVENIGFDHLWSGGWKCQGRE
jgi:hypothetical protein